MIVSSPTYSRPISPDIPCNIVLMTFSTITANQRFPPSWMNIEEKEATTN